MKRTIRLTESELRGMIQEAVEEAINNEELDEGLWNQLKTGANTFMNNNGGDSSETFMKKMKNRWNAAKANYKTQGELDDITGLINQLTQFIDDGEIDPQITVAQLVGGKYNKGNRFGKMTGKMNNRKSQLRQRGFQGNYNV